NAAVFVGAGGVGVQLQHVQVGLALMQEIVTSGTGRSYYALDASGSAALVGVPGLTLSGTIDVQVNHASTGSAVDFSQLVGGKLSIPTGAGNVDLAFTGDLLRAAGSLTLSLDGFA